MKATGGAIRLEKSFTYLLSFKFKPNVEYQYEKVQDLDLESSARNEYIERKIIQSIDTCKGKETLGVVIALDRNIVDCLVSLRRKVLKWKDSIQIRKLLGEEIL